MTKNIKKLVILNIPYILVGLVCTNLGEAWRIAQGSNASEKVQSLILDGAFGAAFANPMPSFLAVSAREYKRIICSSPLCIMSLLFLFDILNQRVSANTDLLLNAKCFQFSASD